MKAKEFTVVEKKRKNRGPRWAAYGPGPYGGYGYLTGYSGDGGSVGEASYEGNIGMMELMKFYQSADDDQKKLLKKLVNQNKTRLAWKLIQQVTGTKLQGQEFDEGIGDMLKKGLAGAAVAGTMAMTSPAVSAEPVSDKIVASVVIDGEERKFDLTSKNFRDVKEAGKWLERFLDDRGIENWNGKIERGVPGSGNYQRMRITNVDAKGVSEDDGVAASPELQKAHDEERARRGLPDPDYYLKLRDKIRAEIAAMKAQDEKK
jgi:hypothetical protein